MALTRLHEFSRLLDYQKLSYAPTLNVNNVNFVRRWVDFEGRVERDLE